MDKSIIDRGSIESIVEFLEGIKADFSTVLTNYTTSIQYGDKNNRFLKSFRGKRCFAAYNQIKTDVSKHKPPAIKEEDLQYFFHDIKSNFSVSKAIQIDIKKAYATALKNKGYITDKTFSYISSLNKNDRLASVGMLASIKHEFSYKRGKVDGYKTIESPTKNFFLYCVKEVQDIMNVCRMEAYGSYILTWVDAIYITYNEKVASEIQKILFYNGFDSEREVIYNLNAVVSNNKISLSLFDGFRHKKFNIPHSSNVLAKHLVKYINRNERKNF